MNTATPEPEGSTREQQSTNDSAPGTDWAYGMPLSFVHEMANRWLSLYDQAAKVTGPGSLEDSGTPSPQPAAD
jgi:hypothetical protein